MIDPLSRLAIQHGTDKYGYHDYTPNYFDLFQHIADKPIKLLEIGVGGYGSEDRGGESLATWRDFFTNAQIIGIDIQKKALDLGDRVHILQGSQVDPDFLKELVQDYGPFDIIIDDGSHRNEHVVDSFHILFPTLNPGGIYVVEDTQTAFMPRFGGSIDLEHPNTIGLFATYLKKMMGQPQYTEIAIDDISMIERFHNIVALHKAPGKTQPRWVDAIESGHLAKCRSANVTALGPGDIYNQLETVPMMGGLNVERPEEEGFPDDCIDDAAKIFVEIDHREIAIRFEDHPTNPMAKETRALAVSDKGIFLHKAPNDYPSNFDYDAENPQAKAALEHMANVLAEGGSENGILQYTEILTRLKKPDEAAKLLAQLKENAPNSRRYFEAALVTARRNRETDTVKNLLEAAVKAHPNDPNFTADLAGQRLRERKVEDAIRLLEPALEQHPRARVLHSQMSNALTAQGRFNEALESLDTAIKLSPATIRPHLQLGLVNIHIRAKNYPEAKKITQIVLSENDTLDRAYRLLSEIHLMENNSSDALEAIEKALELSPDHPAYLRWRDRVKKP